MYKYLESAWQKYLMGELSLNDTEQIKLYKDYMEEDNLDYTRQRITKILEGHEESNQDSEENDEINFENEGPNDEYDKWAALDRDELAKIVFSDSRVKTEAINSNPGSDNEYDVDFKINNLSVTS